MPVICLYRFPKEQGSIFLWDVDPTCSVGPTFEKQPHKALLHEPTLSIKKESIPFIFNDESTGSCMS
jgi:hypothetical protein